MNDDHPQSALREWRAHIRHPATLTALVVVGAVLGIAGPLNTDQVLPLAPRILYWLATVVLTYGLGSLCDAVLRGRLAHLAFWTSVAVRAAVTGVAISGAVLVINAVTFVWVPPIKDLPVFVATTFVIAAIVTIGIATVQRQMARDVPAPAPAHAPVRILDRLPIDKRAPLVALSVEDHYVRIFTTNGEELVLMRLSDAIGEVGPTRGAQVHRSHWAAFEHVKKVRRVGDRAILTMANGTEVPVSRANIATLKEAGLLP